MKIRKATGFFGIFQNPAKNQNAGIGIPAGEFNLPNA
jgi:hypothetical protein